jgi:hypothetical protein
MTLCPQAGKDAGNGVVQIQQNVTGIVIARVRERCCVGLRRDRRPRERGPCVAKFNKGVREDGEVSTELAVGARLASSGGLTAVKTVFQVQFMTTFRAETPQWEPENGLSGVH